MSEPVDVRQEWGVRRVDGKERLWTCDGQREASEWVTGHNADTSKPPLTVLRRTVSTSPWVVVPDGE